MRTAFILLFLALFIGCGKSLPKIESVSNVGGKILMPSGRVLKYGKLLFIPTERYDVAKSLSVEIKDDGSFKSEENLYEINYKIMVLTGRGKERMYIKKYVPEKYYDREEEDSDLFVNPEVQADNLVLKIKKWNDFTW